MYSNFELGINGRPLTVKALWIENAMASVVPDAR